MEIILIQSFVEKYGNNKLISPIKYIFSQFSEIDLNLIKIIKYIETILNKRFNKKLKLDKIVYTFNCLYHSNKIIYDLPHIMNKIISNSKPSLHIVYGETISQLVSLSLYTECLDYINNFYVENNISKEIRNNSINLFLDKLITINPSLENENFEKKNFENFIKELYLLAINVSVNMFLEIKDKSMNEKIINDIEIKYLIDLKLTYE